MSKRSRNDGLPSDPEGREGSSKRPHIDKTSLDLKPLDSMLAYANKLVKRIEDLRNTLQAEDSAADVRRQDKLTSKLRGTCQDILPSIQAFVGETDSAPRTKSDAQLEIKTSALPTGNAAPSSSAQPHSTPQTACSPIPSPLILTRFATADIPSSLPPLPSIRDPILEAAAFTHSGTGAPLNYERLEWLGDAYTEVISSSLLFRTFGGHSSGRLSQMRELLICNANLGKYSTQYGLVDRANITPEIRESKEKWKKVPGDLFEAYVAAVILSDPEHGLQRAGEWLKALFSMTIRTQIHTLSNKPEHLAVLEMGDRLDPNQLLSAKSRLQQLIGAKGVIFRYEDDPTGPKNDKFNKRLPVHSVNLFLDGWGEKNKWLGRGTDINKREAGNKAAQIALDNKALIKKFSDKKAALQAATADAGENVDDEAEQ